MVNHCSEYQVPYTKIHFDIFDHIYKGELVEILDDGNIKLIPPTESASYDKNIETIYPAPGSQLLVISSKEPSNHLRISALGSHELDDPNSVDKALKTFDNEMHNFKMAEGRFGGVFTGQMQGGATECGQDQTGNNRLGTGQPPCVHT